MFQKPMPCLSGAVLLILVFTCSSLSQGQWKWPEKPENLQVLPKDWPGSRLRPVMTGFTRALGVRCSYCHVGEEGKPLSTFDFKSDANPKKNTAREMLRMLGDVNDHLKKIEYSGDKHVNMWCHTCHRGRPRPMTLAEELGEQYRLKGVGPALVHYASLKKDFYGRGAYDFGEGALNEFGYEVLRAKDVTGAIRVFELNAESFPESANVWDSVGEAYLASGDTLNAIASYEKSLLLEPKNRNAEQILNSIKPR